MTRPPSISTYTSYGVSRTQLLPRHRMEIEESKSSMPSPDVDGGSQATSRESASAALCGAGAVTRGGRVLPNRLELTIQGP